MTKKDGLLALLVTFIWGINFSVIKLGLGSMDPFVLASLRFFLTAIPLVFFLPRPEVKFSMLILYGLLFGVGLWGMVNLGIHLGASPGVASLLVQLSAFFTIIFGYFFFSEKLNSKQIAAMLVSLCGLAILIFSSNKSSNLVALLFVVLGALSMGLSNVMIKKLSPKNVFSFMAWSSLFAPIPLLVLAVLTNENLTLASAFSSIDGWGVFSISFQVYITTLFAYWVWNNLLKKYPISTVAPISLLVPVFGFIGSAVIFHEELTAIKLLSSGLILLGLVIFVLSNRVKKGK